MSTLEFDMRFARGDFELRAAGRLEGGVTGICGPSGAGKSTLLALIAGLLSPQHGRLSFGTETLVDSSRKLCVPPWRRHFGLVFQDGLLFPHLSVRGNLLYGERRLEPGARRLTLDAVAALLELGPLLTRKSAQLSGGERQRVALGRALLYSPRLLLLDEPLASLDERLKQQILPFLRRIKHEIQIPMVYVSHERREVEFLADRTLWMRQGQLLTGPVAAASTSY